MTRETFDELDAETQNGYIEDFLEEHPDFDEDGGVIESAEFIDWMGFHLLSDEELYGDHSVVPERLIAAAEHHKENSGDQHAFGDLEDAINAAWAVMTPAQRKVWLADPRVQAVFRAGDLEDSAGLPILPEP